MGLMRESDNAVFEVEYRMKHSNGEWRWLRSRDTLFARTKEGVGSQILGLSEDITEQKQAQENLTKHQELLNSMLESSEGPIFSVDRNYRYTSFNKRHAEVMKTLYGADIQIGANILDYHTNPSDRLAAKNNIDKTLKGESIIIESYAGANMRNRRFFEIAHNPIRNTINDVTGAAIFAKDITDRKKAEENLRVSERLLKEAQAVAHIGNWEWNIRTGVLIWGEENYRIFGLPPETVPSVENFLRTVHPDDAAFVK